MQTFSWIPQARELTLNNDGHRRVFTVPQVLSGTNGTASLAACLDMALAMLAQVAGGSMALRWYKAFARERLYSKDDTVFWQITSDEILLWLAAKREQERGHNEHVVNRRGDALAS